jgi:tRNA(Ile)-lysidine synthetase-like protein
LIRKAIGEVRGNLHSIGFGHVEAILDLARQSEGSGRLQVPEVDVYRSFDWVRFAPIAVGDQLAARNQEMVCPVPGISALPVAGVQVDLEVIENKSNFGSPVPVPEGARVRVYELDWDRVLELGSELRLRTWKPGDQYVPAGERVAATRKVKTMFQEARIPLWDRGTWPIITVGPKIVWTREFGPAAEVAVGRDSRRLLRVSDRIREN